MELTINNFNRSSDRKKLILLAEDNPVNRKVLLAQLKSIGLTAKAVYNGREAVEEVSGGDYALVLMDCQMPVMNGFEATRAIRLKEPDIGYRIPIIGITALAMQDDHELCIAAGMDDYISKPVGLVRLHETIRRWMP